MESNCLSDLLNQLEQEVNEKRDLIYEKIMRPDCHGLRRSSLLYQFINLLKVSDALGSAAQRIRKNHNRCLHKSAKQRQVISPLSPITVESQSPPREAERSTVPRRPRVLVIRRAASVRPQPRTPSNEANAAEASPAVPMVSSPAAPPPTPSHSSHGYDLPCCARDEWDPESPATPFARRMVVCSTPQPGTSDTSLSS